ncbi:MAG: protein-L-isoaspartate(D-aspartate) O-methyltransferase [Candidatus Hydrogenedentota bacterium]
MKKDIDFKQLRERMVKEQIERRGVKDKRVLDVMRKIERHKFVPLNVQRYAYEDCPQPIGMDQTISQPYIVALMTELLELKGDEKVLEIGTGSGYQAAVLAELCKEVYTIEIIPELGNQARERLKGLGYKNIKVLVGDGYKGWPEYAPFDAIIITAAPPEIPQPLIDQLDTGGILVAPVGVTWQELFRVQKSQDGNIIKEPIIPVRFVPMVGEAQQKEK